MIQNQPIMITLLTGEHPRELPVVAFNGQEAINAPYRFTVDLLIRDPALDLDLLRRSNACLTLDPLHVIHARITSVSMLHAGNGASLYRLNLGPALLDLQQAPQRRLFRQLSVIQIIEQLLGEHHLSAQAYRFEPLVGIYPPRPLCVQHDETDLYLLQRLCEEEGIHFHFEHSREMHTLVFADDPACFPARYFSVPMRLPGSGAAQDPAMEHLAERWAMQPPVIRHQITPRAPRKIALAHGSKNRKQASNQHFEACDRSRLPTEREAHDRQRSARALEQQRCERRLILGRGSELPLTSGQIIQVQDHPETRFNDQWLLVEVDHFGKQPQVLLGNDPHDAAAILAALESQQGRDSDHQRQADWRAACSVASFKRGYRNRFRLLPWEMPFRPSLAHSKPVAAGYQSATLLDAPLQHWQSGDEGCLSVSLDALPGEPGQLNAPAYLAPRQLNRLGDGARVILGHFDNDPDRPIICAVQPSPDLMEAQDQALPSSSICTAPSYLASQTQEEVLNLRSDETLSLSLGNAVVEVARRYIRLTTRQTQDPSRSPAPLLSDDNVAELAPDCD